MPHVALTIWVYSRSKRDRHEVLSDLWTAVNFVYPEDSGHFRAFYSEAMIGTTNFKQVVRAALRELKGALEQVSLIALSRGKLGARVIDTAPGLSTVWCTMP